MKILAIGEFDPCGVHLRQRHWLRRLGVDYRLAVHDVYWDEGVGADAWQRKIWRTPEAWGWHVADGVSYEGIAEFALEADLLVFLPSINQAWSCNTTEPRFAGDADLRPYGPIDWTRLGGRARRVAVFHGSVNLAANPKVYASHYAARGFRLAATTLDYVHRMATKRVTYLPTIVDLVERTPAALRRDDEPLRITHTPSDSRVCNTADYIRLCEQTPRVQGTLATGMEHEACLQLKIKHHAGFDHMRGSFSINSLENAALGLVNLVAVRAEYRDYLREQMGVELPWPEIETLGDAQDEMRALAESPALTRVFQERARRWYLRDWHPELSAKRVLAAFEEMTS